MVRQESEVFKLHGVECDLAVEHPDCPHEFQPAMRERAYKFIADTLK